MPQRPQLWADRFDGELEDIFDLQDQVTASVVGAISPKLEQAEIERVKKQADREVSMRTIIICVAWRLSMCQAGGKTGTPTTRHIGCFARPLSSTRFRGRLCHGGDVLYATQVQ